MKKHYLLFIIIASTFVFLPSQSTIVATTQYQESFVVKNTKSPFYGKTAYRKNVSEPWHIPGNLDKDPTWEKYKKGQCKGEGVQFDKACDYPINFKKIYWFHTLLNNQHDCTAAIQCLSKGFAVKCWEKSHLETMHGSMPMHSGAPFLYHPKAEKAVNHLMKTVKEDYNVFEIGCLLGYRIQDAYIWSFGSSQGKKAYPDKVFTEHQESYDASKMLLWRKFGLNRLKNKLGDDYAYIIAGDEPTNDSMFGSIQEQAYLKELRQEKIFIYGGLIVGGVLWVGILYHFLYKSKKTQPNKNILQKVLKTLNLSSHCT